MNNITVTGNFTFDKLKILITSFLITIAIGITIYYAVDKPTDTPTDISIDTDIDWTKPPCNPDDLSDDWNEVTHPKMVNRREFIYKNTNIKITFEVGIIGKTGFKAIDHWHRYNPNTLNKHDLYLDRNGNPTRRGSSSSHIDPNCK